MNNRLRKHCWSNALIVAFCHFIVANNLAAIEGVRDSIPDLAVGQVVSAPQIDILEVQRKTTAFVGAPEVGCRAATRWMPAQLLRQRAKAIEDAHCKRAECQRNAARVLANFLRQQACAQEDLGAGAALRAYYSRVAIQQQLLLANDGNKLLEEQLNSVDALISSGLGSVDLDRSELVRRKIELSDQILVARRTDSQLREALCHLAEIDFSIDSTQLEALEVVSQSLSCDELCFLAISQRHDLMAWECLCRGIDDCTAEILSSVLTPLVGGVPLSLPKNNLFDKLFQRDASCIAVNVRKEVGLAHQQLKSRIIRSTHDKCIALQVAYQRIDLAVQIAESLEERISQLENLQAKGNSAAVPLFEARGQLAIARSTVNQRRLEARLAEVDLAEEVGGLARRCCDNEPWLPVGR